MFKSDIDDMVYKLTLPDGEHYIYQGNIIRIGRFSSESWRVHYGWYEFGGNRKICGWYAENAADSNIIKPIQDADLLDIYYIQA